MKDGKTLIVYFSHMGNTEKFANKIHELIGGDIVKLESVSPIYKFFDDYDFSGKNIIPFNTRPTKLKLSRTG